ncbi:MAG TPA: tautomerase family protein [Nitrososphaeraceae archaeon]|jgi:4-oxalocrotonate tautomerase|nr:tautomerase family protein [Nitrososphaeraceae archaeon]
MNLFSYMPLISVSLYPGRTKEQKEEFAKAITEAAIEILKAKAEHIIVVYDEKSKENWYISGKHL